MINLNIPKGARLEFDYDCPKSGPGHRIGFFEKAYRAKKTKDKLIVFNIFDKTQDEYRSFHFNKMRNIRVSR